MTASNHLLPPYCYFFNIFFVFTWEADLADQHPPGRWKVLHYTAKDIYQPVIISPFYNITTGDFEIYVTSDLWSSATGTATFQWYHWDGTPIAETSTPSVAFTVGALNTTRVLKITLDNSTLDFNDALLYMSVTAKGQLPNTDTTTTFTHDNFFHPFSLAEAELVDPGLVLSYDDKTMKFTVEATTGIAIWTWLDYPAGALVQFEDNGFLLLPGRKKEVGFTLVSGTVSELVGGVTVGSLWDNKLP